MLRQDYDGINVYRVFLGHKEFNAELVNLSHPALERHFRAVLARSAWCPHRAKTRWSGHLGEPSIDKLRQIGARRDQLVYFADRQSKETSAQTRRPAALVVVIDDGQTYLAGAEALAFTPRSSLACSANRSRATQPLSSHWQSANA